MTVTPNALVKLRSGSRCEAMVAVMAGHRAVPTRCFRSPVEIHHRLTRARGGDLLDVLGETYHLMALCHLHHKHAHEVRDNQGLMLDGSVQLLGSGRVLYTGPDQYLNDNYGGPGVMF